MLFSRFWILCLLRFSAFQIVPRLPNLASLFAALLDKIADHSNRPLPNLHLMSDMNSIRSLDSRSLSRSPQKHNRPVMSISYGSQGLSEMTVLLVLFKCARRKNLDDEKIDVTTRQSGDDLWRRLYNHRVARVTTGNCVYETKKVASCCSQIL